jgi:hypothetical protein
MGQQSVITRQEAIDRELTRFFTGVPCRHGHVAERLVSSLRCCECHRLRKQQLRIENPAKYQEKTKAKYHSDPSRFREYRKRDYIKNRELRKEARRAHYAANQESSRATSNLWKSRNKAHQVAYRAKWYALNIDKELAANAVRRAGLALACPKWVSKKDLLAIYKKCRELSRTCKIKYHVDHIVPLKGKIVCGLHVPWNLQIILASENLKKKNKFPHAGY